MKNNVALLFIFLTLPAIASAQVTQQWAARFAGAGDDVATAVAVDALGNVYVTGFTQVSGLDYDYQTIKYDSAGNLLWATPYNGTGNGDDVPAAIAVDAFLNVYVTGYSFGGATGYDYATVSYDANGAQRWVARFDGTGGDDFASSLVLDSSGNVYVTGGSRGIGTGLDYATVAYEPNLGGQLWVAFYNGPANGDDVANAITVDAVGNVYVTGQSFGIGGNDYATIAYDFTGAQIFASRYNGPGNGEDVAQGLVVDSAGNTYVTGYSWGVTSGFDYATVAYGPAGGLLWEARYDGPASGNDFAAAIALDPGGSGTIYVTGQSVGIGSDFDFATVAYGAPSGAQLWVGRYNGPGNGRDDAYSVAVSPLGIVYVAGYSLGVGTGYDYATVAYGAGGAQLWAIRYDGPASADDVALNLTVDAQGFVYVTGFSTGIGTGRDFTTIKYSQP